MSNPNRVKTFDELSERQQAACHVFAKKFGVTIETVAPKLTAFFDLDGGRISYSDMERILGYDIRDRQTGSLFPEMSTL